MEDYDILEMKNLNSKKVVLVVEDDENFVLDIINNDDFIVMPIRFSYNLSKFSDEYVKKTKELFSYYYNKDNILKNELVRMKKHFVHYQRNPFIAYVPYKNEYKDLTEILNELNIECLSNKDKFLKKINNKRKLILIDYDETLTKSDDTVSNRVKKAISKHIKIGNKVVICTARPRYQTIDISKNVNASNIVVSSNGAEVYDYHNNKVLKLFCIDKDLVYKMVEYAYYYDVRLILAVDDCDYITKNPYNSKQILLSYGDYKNILKNKKVKQCMYIDENEKDVLKIKHIMKNLDRVMIVNEISKEDTYYEKWFSLGNIDASKGNALYFLADYFNIPIKNTFAIGNDYNDISMFSKSGYSVCVANASEEIKDIVDYVTLSNDEDGVAIFLESILKK